MSNDVVNIPIIAGLTLDISEENFEKARAMLESTPGKQRKAIGHALARAGKSGQTEGKRAVAKEYNISQQAFLANTRTVNHFKNANSASGDLSVEFGFRGSSIPLIKFARTKSRGYVKVNVKKSTGQQVLEHAFYANMGLHTGIYERVDVSRLPVKELYGPATPQMMYANESVREAIGKKVADTFNKRMDHEINRILNGWGK